MNKLLLVFTFVSLLSCQSDNQPIGPATGATGRYVVTTYIVSGDTLFTLLPSYVGLTTKLPINKIGVDNFNIVVEQVPSTERVIVYTSYWRNGLRSTFSKEATVSQTDYQYVLSPIKEFTPSLYEGMVERNRKTFTEHTVGRGALVIPLIDNPSSPGQASPQDVVIVAKHQ